MAHSIRVLITDDHARSRNSLRALLATWPDVEVVGEAANGQEAVRQVGQWQPDVVLMDARMPLMDGLEATRLIKTKWPRTRVIMLTLYATYQTEALAAGADVFLCKGCSDEKLVAAILNDEKPRHIEQA